MPATQTSKDQTLSQLPQLRVYNTLSKSKEHFETVSPGKVGIYLCGPTVYKPSHIGHMVGPVIFDAIKRYLTYCGFDVTLVINITDVDDKLIQQSQERGISMAAVATEMTADYMANLAAMGVDTVDHFPKATESIDEIIRITKQLIDRGFAYTSNGDVYFDVGKDPEYGKLSGRSVESMVGEGGSTAERKRSAADFALWKSAKPGEPAWESPWGKGRPGWHIECSAMSRRLLGETFDIHGGGLDLVFPHHENEVAQSECCHGKPQARYWMHNGLMQASSEVGKLGGRATRQLELGDQAAQAAAKISKSTGASPFSELRERFDSETIRFFLLSTHYRRPIDYSEERLQEIDKALETFYRFFKRYERVSGERFYDIRAAACRLAALPTTASVDSDFSPFLKQVVEHRKHFLEAMDDDFNTGGAIGDLFQLVGTLNKFIDDEKLETAANSAKVAELQRGAGTLKEQTNVLGLFRQPRKEKSAGDDALVGKLMELLIDLRAEARKTKNFAAADKIRKTLTDLGITLEDRPGGTEWTRQK